MKQQPVVCVVTPDRVGGVTKRIAIGHVTYADVKRIEQERKYC